VDADEFVGVALGPRRLSDRVDAAARLRVPERVRALVDEEVGEVVELRHQLLDLHRDYAMRP